MAEGETILFEGHAFASRSLKSSQPYEIFTATMDGYDLLQASFNRGNQPTGSYEPRAIDSIVDSANQLRQNP